MIPVRVITLSLTVIYCVNINLVNGQESVAKTIESLLKDYDVDKTPSSPTAVEISLFLSSAEVYEHVFRSKLYFRLSWNDTRLQRSGGGRLTVPGKYVDRFWKPDVYFRNALKIERYDLPTNQELFSITESGKVWFARTYMVDFSCPMFFHRYPYDNQKCYLRVESYSKTTDDLVLKFRSEGSNALVIGDEVQIPGWIVDDQELVECSQNHSTGQYPCLGFGIYMSRMSGAHKSGAMTFNSLLIALYASFFLGRKMVNIRFGFLFLVGFLFASSISWLQTKSRPDVSYLTTMDIALPITGFLYMTVVLHFLVVQRLYNKGATERKGGPHANKARILDRVGLFGYPVLVVLWFIIYYSTFV